MARKTSYFCDDPRDEKQPGSEEQAEWAREDWEDIEIDKALSRQENLEAEREWDSVSRYEKNLEREL